MELTSLLVGIAFFLVAALPLLVQGAAYAGTRSKYETLQEFLEKRSQRLTHPARHQEGYWIRVLTLLEIGDELIPFITRRLRHRFALLAAIALLSSVLVGGTLNVEAGITGVPWFELPVLAVNWVLQVSLFLRTRLFTDEERTFLHNLGLLHDTIYKIIVLEALEKFNTRCAETLGEEKEALDQEVNELRDRFLASLGHSTGERRVPRPPTP